MVRAALGWLAATAVLAGCSGATPPKSDDDYRREVTSNMQGALIVDLKAVVQAAQDLQTAAPLPLGRGWDATQDAPLIAQMKQAWMRAKDTYERIEGAVGVTFPAQDADLDSRYEQDLQKLGPGGDPYPFDDQGLVGLDAVERILWSDAIPPGVVAYEATVPGYRPARFPATEQEAADFANELCGKLVADASALVAGWTAHNVDIDAAFRGLVNLVVEQRGELAAVPTNAEESRYSQRTMADLRANLAGTRAIYGLFRPWLDSRDGGEALDLEIIAQMQNIQALYDQVPGDGAPTPPPTWNALGPSSDDQATPYGQLYGGVEAAVDPSHEGTLAAEMNQVTARLGL